MRFRFDLPSRIPLFPLEGAVLMPRARIPLHVFEPRYLQMLDDALKTDHPLLPVAVAAIRQAGKAYDPGEGEAFRSQVTRDGQAYQAVLTPISFPGWSLVTVVPESEFLGPVRMTIRSLLIGLAALIAAAGLLSAWLAQRLIAAPLIKVVGEIDRKSVV